MRTIHRGETVVDIAVGVDMQPTTGAINLTISRSIGTPAKHEPAHGGDATAASTWAAFGDLLDAAATSKAAFVAELQTAWPDVYTEVNGWLPAERDAVWECFKVWAARVTVNS